MRPELPDRRACAKYLRLRSRRGFVLDGGSRAACVSCREVGLRGRASTALTLALQCINDIERSDSLPLCVLSVRDRVSDDVWADGGQWSVLC